MGEPVSVSPHDGIDVGLHDILDLFSVGDVLNPLGKLGVPDEGVASDNGAGLGSLFEDLTVSYGNDTTARDRDVPSPNRSS